MNPTILQGERTVNLGGLNPTGAQAVHLIFHQGDERRNHDGGVAAKDRRRLVAE